MYLTLVYIHTHRNGNLAEFYKSKTTTFLPKKVNTKSVGWSRTTFPDGGRPDDGHFHLREGRLLAAYASAGHCAALIVSTRHQARHWRVFSVNWLQCPAPSLSSLKIHGATATTRSVPCVNGSRSGQDLAKISVCLRRVFLTGDAACPWLQANGTGWTTGPHPVQMWSQGP